MTSDGLDQLARLIRQERAAILSRWREQVKRLPSARHLDLPTLNDHIPQMLEDLAQALDSRTNPTIAEALVQNSSPSHGRQRLEDSFEIKEVVAEYNILRGCIHDLGDEHGVDLRGRVFHVVNRVFDQAIGLALEAYVTDRALEVQRHREEYLAFVAHDLRTPLNAISLAGKVLEAVLPQHERADETSQMLKALRRNVLHLENLICKVLDENTNLQTEIGIKLERREFDLWPLVESLIHDLHPVAGTNSTLLFNRVPDDLVVYADASLLRRVFQNLIANAIKYTPSGEIVISARNLPAEGTIEISVSDNGAGIAPEFLDKVFDKGETDPEHVGGAGLGLAIVKAFIETHGGHVTVESNVSVGSTFRCSLPTKATIQCRSH